jgi:cytidine deaminase
VDTPDLSATVEACRALIRDRFGQAEHGAAAMLLDDGTILTGTAPDSLNPAVQICHEIEPFCAAYRLGKSIVASVCLHQDPTGTMLVLSPCGVCRERLAAHGPNVLVAVADPTDRTMPVWKTLKDVLPDYWLMVFPDEVDSGWIA